jgi:hypothetical protein
MNQSIYRTMAPLEVSEGGARGYGPISLSILLLPPVRKRGDIFWNHIIQWFVRDESSSSARVVGIV